MIIIIIIGLKWERRFDKKSRLMTLFITDGSMSIKAIEHQNIPALGDELLPGRKVRRSFFIQQSRSQAEMCVTWY